MEKKYTIEEIDETAIWLLENLPKGTIAFEGGLGAGKTTLIAALCKQLGVEGEVMSPTFPIIHEYQTNRGEAVYHMDMYRIESVGEAIGLGIFDYLDSGAWCFLEWPERIAAILPSDSIFVQVKSLNYGLRQLTIKSHE